jgi:hypothetical protein
MATPLLPSPVSDAGPQHAPLTAVWFSSSYVLLAHHHVRSFLPRFLLQVGSSWVSG